MNRNLIKLYFKIAKSRDGKLLNNAQIREKLSIHVFIIITISLICIQKKVFIYVLHIFIPQFFYYILKSHFNFMFCLSPLSLFFFLFFFFLSFYSIGFFFFPFSFLILLLILHLFFSSFPLFSSFSNILSPPPLFSFQSFLFD